MKTSNLNSKHIIAVLLAFFLVGCTGLVFAKAFTFSGDSIRISTQGYNSNPVPHILTDPLGRKIGYDPRDDKQYNEMDGFLDTQSDDCTEEEAWENYDKTGVVGCGPYMPTYISYVHPVDGIYTIELIGMDSTDFTMAYEIGRNPHNVLYGYIEKDVVYTFKLTYNSTNPASSTISRVVTALDLKRDIKLAWEINDGINNEGIMNSLLKKAEAAEDAANRGQHKTAINLLKAFINEVKAQTGKHLDERAATILTEDAEYIIKELEAK